jgi:hypothetical protein
METRDQERNAMSGFMKTGSRVAKLMLVAALGATLGSCNSVDRLMEVKNPERLREQDLTNENLVTVLVNSAQGDFQAGYAGTYVWIGEMLTDEMITGVNWEDYKRANNRQVIYYEGPADGIFSYLEGARYTAELSYKNLSEMDPVTATGDQLAEVLGYAGYAYILMGDALCGATIDEGSEIYTPAQLYQFAIDRLTEGLTKATSADVKNWLNVGLARAHLNRLEYTQAMQFAAAVTDQNFVKWVEYVEDTRADNPMYGEVTGANFTVGIHPRFMNGGMAYWLKEVPDALQTDPRIQHESMWHTGHDAITPLYKPYQSWSYSGYTGKTIADGAAKDSDTGVPLYRRSSSMKLASYLEARHIYYEAGLWSGSVSEADVLAFVNSRRAYGNEAAVSYTGEALKNELREQRAKDLFMGGFRLGDLRRYAAQGNPPAQHAFPTGPHPVADRGNYYSSTCFPIPLSEYQGNPNVQDPNTGG